METTHTRVLFYFMLFLSVLAWGQSPGDDANRSGQLTDNWATFKYDFTSILGGIGHAYTRPLHWQKDDWLIFGGVVAGTWALYTIDDDADRWFSRQKEDVPRLIQDYGWYYGNPQNNYAFTGVVYFTGLFTRNEKIRRTGLLMISSASATGLLQQVSKSVVGRARPRSGLDKNHFKPFPGDSEYHSFPSGHTALAFTTAYAIAKQFRSPWVKGGIYLLGSIPAMTRLWEGAHWLTDITLSVALSIATVEAIDTYLDKRYGTEVPKKRHATMAWNLQIRANGLGLTGTF